MLDLVLVLGLTAQAPSPGPPGEASTGSQAAATSATAAAPAAVPLDDPVNYPAAAMPLTPVLEPERRYAIRLSQATHRDLRQEWLDYLREERARLRQQLGGRDYDIEPFGDYLDRKYRTRCFPGLILFAAGFFPLGIGTVLGVVPGILPENSQVPAITIGFGAIMVGAGGVLWAVRGAQLLRYRKIRAALDRPDARAHVQWRGLMPLLHPQLRTHGVAVGLAF